MPVRPRAACPVCDRLTALTPTRRLGFGALADHKRERRALVLCPGSETHVPYSSATAWQDELPVGAGMAGEDWKLF